MAIKWGSYVTIGGVRYRTGLDVSYSPTTVTGSTSSVTVTTRIYLGIPSTYQASGINLSWSVTGSDSGSGDGLSWSIATGAGSRLISTLTETVSLTYGSTKNFSVTGRIRPIFSAGTWTPTVTASVTIPARPVSRPAAPSGASVSRTSDTRHTVTWTRNATTSAPYTNLQLSRWDNVSAAYSSIATLSGSATNYADTTTRADRRYRYAVRARDAAGNSAYTYTGYISTTPAAPNAPVAKKSGTGIAVSRPTSLSTVASHWEVWHAADGVWDSARLALVPAGTSSWTHASPDPTKTHVYRVKAYVADPVTLTSAYSPSSATVQLEAPPAAPTRLSPAAAVDASYVIPLSWQHNPVDTTDQTAYEIEWRVGSSGVLTSTGKVASGEAEHEVLPGAWSNGTTIQWRVRTWGSHPDPGAWSTFATLPLSTAPVAGILEPDDGSTVEGSSAVVRWTYFQGEGSPYTGWELQVLRGAEVIFSRQSSTTTSYRTPSILEDGVDYTIRVRVRSGAGIWSEWDSVAVAVDYAPPPTPTLAATFRAEGGYVTLTPTVAAAGPGEVEAASVAVYRAAQGGWVLIEDGLDSGDTVTDMIPPLGEAVQYRAVATSALPSTATSAPVPVDTSGGDAGAWVYINHGPGFGQVVRVSSNVTGSRGSSRAKVLHHFAGRPDPVEYATDARTKTFTVASSLWEPCIVGEDDEASDWVDFDALADALAPVCLRGPHGLREFVSVDGVSESGLYEPESRVTASFMRIDWSEDVQP